MSARKVEVEQVVDAISIAGEATPAQLAMIFGCSVATIQRNIDGAIYQQLLIVNDHDEEGYPLNKSHWRYAVNEVIE